MKVDADKLRQYSEAYGVAVRAGALTPNRVDETFFRELFGLPELPEEVKRSWDESKGVKAPITLANRVQTSEPLPGVTEEEQQALNMIKEKHRFTE